MNSHPIVLLDPIFKWLDWVITEYGLYLYMAAVFVAPLGIARISAGGFRRRRAVNRRRLSPSTSIPLPAPPPIPANPSGDDESKSFSA